MFNERKERRFVVRIWIGDKPLNEQVYFRKDMTYAFFMKWKWYFEYRAALLKVKNPKTPVELYITSYEYELPRDIYEKRLKSIIKSRKGSLTTFNRKLDSAKKNWNSLFPIENDPNYCKVIQKQQRLEKELKMAQEKLEHFNSYKEEIDSKISSDIVSYSTEEILEI